MRMILLRSITILASISSAAALTLRDAIEVRDDVIRFQQALIALDMFEQVLGDETQTFTVFAPSDSAIDDSELWNLYFNGIDENPPTWSRHLRAAVNNCIVKGPGLTKNQIFNDQITELESLQDPLLISQFLGRVGGAPIETADLAASNGVLHVMSAVLEPDFFDHSFADLEQQSEFGPDVVLNRTSLVDVVNLVGVRGELGVVRPEGTTMVGCRIRGFVRMGQDYLPQTLNDSFNVESGELMNITRANQTYAEVEYSLIAQNYYSEEILPGFYDLVLPVNDCAHMWVNEFEGILVFNDGRTVETPQERTFLASNGPGYVLDRCLVCPGISMLVEYAGDWSPFDTKATSQFLISSEWNMRNLSLSVGDGDLVTMFAPVKQAWSVLNQDDIVRLASDKWKPHQWNLLGNIIVQGIWMEQDLKDKYKEEGGPFNLTSLVNETVAVDYDEERDVVMVSGGDLFFADIKGVDGRVHFVTVANLPFSMTDTVYDVAKKRDDLTFHVTLIDTVMLNEDLEFLLPLTAVYVNNDGWDGIQIKLDDIAPVILESHIFENLLWCNDLRALSGTRVESLNGQTWFVVVNDDNMPCFLTEETAGGEPQKACITECDILSRNGLVHVMDRLLVYQTSESGDVPQPTAQLDFSQPGSAPTFTRPTPNSGGGSPSSFSSPSSTANGQPSGSAFDGFGSPGSSPGANKDNAASGAASKLGVVALAGALTLLLMLQNA